MKYLFLLAGLAVFGFASAQDDALHYFQKKWNKQNKVIILPQYETMASFQVQSNYLSQKKEDSYVLQNGNKVTLSAQDNMPCIKPDMRQFNMPNAGSPGMIQRGKNAIPDFGLTEKIYFFPSPFASGIKNQNKVTVKSLLLY
jgi:hypothetical protein